ncbi:MAG TPA: DEAD/DEAH box helicase, partial [Chthonomonadales bacterium]|nr:DEAD/DEAH box helicase [Chthonomonadales bacterium]
MNFDGYLRDLRSARFYKDQIVHVERIPERYAVYGELNEPLLPALQNSLSSLGVQRLYLHQAASINAARAGRNVTVVTGTASGKTLCYNLPILEAVLQDTSARALYLFPTKALAQDQLGKLDSFGLFPVVRYGPYDGDTLAAERRAIRQNAHIVLTNPDMLHIGILPNHSAWSRFLRNLRYVVVDEMHSYRGVFGAHVAQLLRRLVRICEHYKAHPRFLCCSATIANPAHLTARLTGTEDFLVIDENGAPSGPRTFVFWNPPVVDYRDGSRRSAHVESAALFADLVGQEIRTIAFARARKSVELILKYSQAEFQAKTPEFSSRVRSYRAGYTATERREIEKRLFGGQL